ncbi:vacuolar protein sorting-associated protein 41 [Suhomyces tanzawaensis NRRL Y-17324]|uniref:Vacuolar protein sorting-associated protein 41 n=1 Tax=Suhomyces tanzawaensis NRRL Y-17324 TaxID=984487 RepID=A0A1E4SLY8_9ASCO|nr:vacuolar protein sorting-associated protein 41 [Suhomyces tanzawaensis NRRL Y-17324]ODV80417.1 vacuolar protein sorting-associated protein 41 [Suhomyces tanzawaensis NRRL Y-17324]
MAVNGVKSDIDSDTTHIDHTDAIDKVNQLPSTSNDTTLETSNDSDTGDEDEEDDEEDDDEDDEPPKLKYTRITKLPPQFFTKDPVSASTFHESYFIFATHSGTIHITTPTFERVRTFKAHRALVLSVYCDGTYFATGSMDGTVVIGSIKGEQDITAYDFHRPIHAVVLDRSYAKTGGFVTGGMSGKVTYSSKSGWLGKRHDVVLDEGNGPIVSIELIDDLLFWMNDRGITICQLSTRKIIKQIDKPEDSPRSDLYWPRVNYPETNRILIAWGNYIWSLKVSISKGLRVDDGEKAFSLLPSSATVSFRGSSIYAQETKLVEVEHIYKVDSLISGIASFKDDLWLVLTYEPPTFEESKEDDRRGKRVYNNPEIKIINSTNGEVEFEEELGLRDVQGLGLNDYTLGTSHIAGMIPSYFIISAKDGVIVQEFQLSDRLKWYLEHEKYYDAWSISMHLTTRIKRLGFGVQHLDGLVKENEWNEAATFLAQLLQLTDKDLAPDGDTKSTLKSQRSVISSSEELETYVREVVKQWETWGEIFVKSGHISEFTDIIPKLARLGILKQIYNRILEYWIAEPEKFIEVIGNWDSDVYDSKKVQSIIELKLEEEEYENLRRCLAQLYVTFGEPKKAVKHLMKLKDYDLVQFLSDNHILVDYKSDLPKMIKMRFSDNELETLPMEKLEERIGDIVDVLVKHQFEIPPKEIISLFGGATCLGFINYFYIERLDDPSIESDETIRLYSHYNRSKLIKYLTRNEGIYDIDKAIAICAENDFIEELVFLLGKIGESQRALELIIDRMDDAEMAIRFAKSKDDAELWNVLIDYSMKKPNFVRALIEHSDEQSNQYYDPVQILQKMDPSIKVAGLSESIIKFTHNNDLNLLINQGMLRIVYKQAQEVSERYRLEILRGLEIPESKRKTYLTLLISKDVKEVAGGKIYTNLADKINLIKEYS